MVFSRVFRAAPPVQSGSHPREGIMVLLIRPGALALTTPGRQTWVRPISLPVTLVVCRGLALAIAMARTWASSVPLTLTRPLSR